MIFNKDQREGFAKFTDNLASASMIAAIVGGLVDGKIGWITVMLLCIFSIVFLFAGAFLRKEGDKDGD